MKNHGINVQKFQVADGDNDVSELVKKLGNNYTHIKLLISIIIICNFTSLLGGSSQPDTLMC
jgi:hypothetical protein